MAKGVRTAIAHLIRTWETRNSHAGERLIPLADLILEIYKQNLQADGYFCEAFHAKEIAIQGFPWPGESFSSWKADSEKVGTTHARGSTQLPVKNTNTDLFSLLLSEPIIWSSIAALHFLVYSLSIDNLHIEFLRQFFKHL